METAWQPQAMPLPLQDRATREGEASRSLSLSIELSPDSEQQLRAEAAREGLTPEEFARTAVEEKLAAALVAQVGRNKGLIDLLRQWREEPPDLEEAEGYPSAITPRHRRTGTRTRRSLQTSRAGEGGYLAAAGWALVRYTPAWYNYRVEVI